MTSAEMISAAILKKKAVVYVRQSTQSQVMTNLEGKRRQYDLVDVAVTLLFTLRNRFLIFLNDVAESQLLLTDENCSLRCNRFRENCS